MPEESIETQASLQGIHVLLVADDPESAELVKTVLEYSGSLVSITTTARAALRALEAMRPDVLLCDLVTAGLEDSTWLIGQVRALPHGVRLPAVVLTQRGSRDARRRALEAGFEAQLAKPVDPWELCRVVAAQSRADA